MDCRGEVVEKDGKKALVRVARVNCAECGGCGILARDRERTVEFTVTDRLGVEVGDEVMLRVPSGRLYLAHLTVFGLPVLAMAAAWLLATVALSLAGAGGGEGIGVIAAVAAGFAFFWVGIKLAERMGFMPRMTGRALDGGKGGDPGPSGRPGRWGG